MKLITNDELEYYTNLIYAEYPFLKETKIAYLATLQKNEIILFVCNVPKANYQRLLILWPRLDKPLDGYYPEHYPESVAPHSIELKPDTCKLLINDPILNIGDDTIIVTNGVLNLTKDVAAVFKNRNIRIIDDNTLRRMLNQHIMRNLAKKGKFPHAN